MAVGSRMDEKAVLLSGPVSVPTKPLPPTHPGADSPPPPQAHSWRFPALPKPEPLPLAPRSLGLLAPQDTARLADRM